MPSGAVAAAGGGGSSAPATAMNPFWAASNWYFEANNIEIANGSFQLTTSQKAFSVPLNTNGFLKDYRITVRATGAVGGAPTGDDPTQWYDYARNINPSFTLKLAPEIRYTAGALANMDSRRNYVVAGQLATLAQLNGGSASTAP